MGVSPEILKTTTFHMNNFVWPEPLPIDPSAWRGARLFRAAKPSDRPFAIRSVKTFVQSPSKSSDAPQHIAITIARPSEPSPKSKQTNEQTVALVVLDRTPKHMLLSTSEVSYFISMNFELQGVQLRFIIRDCTLMLHLKLRACPYCYAFCS